MLTDDYDDEMPTMVGPLDDTKAENLRRYIAAVEKDVAKRRLKTPMFIGLLCEYLARWDARPRTLH